MRGDAKNLNSKWEVSIIELENSKGRLFKVTRKFPEMSIAETRILRNKEKAKKLFYKWLD